MHGGLGLGAPGLSVLHAELGRRAAPGPYIATLSVAQWLAELPAGAACGEHITSIAQGELTAAMPVAVLGACPLDLNNGKVTGQADLLGGADAGLAVVPVGSGGLVAGWALIRPGDANLEVLETWDRTRQLIHIDCAGVDSILTLPDPDGTVGRRLWGHAARALAADSLGGASNIAHQTVDYLKTRIQFDRPIASFQAIKHRAANLVASIATQEHLLEQATECAADASPDASMWAALAKAGATECFSFVSGDCIQLHGGVGHTWEFDPHIFAKRARLNEALVGDNRAMRDFAAEALAIATRSGRVTTELGA